MLIPPESLLAFMPFQERNSLWQGIINESAGFIWQSELGSFIIFPFQSIKLFGIEENLQLSNQIKKIIIHSPICKMVSGGIPGLSFGKNTITFHMKKLKWNKTQVIAGV